MVNHFHYKKMLFLFLFYLFLQFLASCYIVDLLNPVIKFMAYLLEL